MKDYLNGRLAKVIQQLSGQLTSRAEIYKIYNHGFIVKTKSATIAIDLITHRYNQTLISDTLTKKLTKKCDALFLTHRHRDHCDNIIVNQFLTEGKPVFAPNDYLPENDSIVHLTPDTFLNMKVSLRRGCKIKLRVLPGHQNELQCNNYAITFPLIPQHFSLTIFISS